MENLAYTLTALYPHPDLMTAKDVEIWGGAGEDAILQTLCRKCWDLNVYGVRIGIKNGKYPWQPQDRMIWIETATLADAHLVHRMMCEMHEGGDFPLLPSTFLSRTAGKEKLPKLVDDFGPLEERISPATLFQTNPKPKPKK